LIEQARARYAASLAQTEVRIDNSANAHQPHAATRAHPAA
jgi:hypothetical protein